MSDQSTEEAIVHQLRQHVAFESTSQDDLRELGVAIAACIEEGGLLSGYKPLDSVVFSQARSGATVTGRSAIRGTPYSFLTSGKRGQAGEDKGKPNQQIQRSRKRFAVSAR